MIPANAPPSHDKVTHLYRGAAAAKPMQLGQLRPRLARRPGEFPPSEHVEVQMPHGLAGVVAVVHDQPEVVADASLAGDAPHRLKQLATEGLVIKLRELCHVLPGHDQHVEGCAGEDVVDRHDVVVLVDDGRGDLPRHDATEQAVVHAAKRIPTWR